MKRYRIRAGKEQFDDPHWVSTIKRWDFAKDKSISECGISSFVFWSCKKEKTVIKNFLELTDYALEHKMSINYFSIEEYEEEP